MHLSYIFSVYHEQIAGRSHLTNHHWFFVIQRWRFQMSGKFIAHNEIACRKLVIKRSYSQVGRWWWRSGRCGLVTKSWSGRRCVHHWNRKMLAIGQTRTMSIQFHTLEFVWNEESLAQITLEKNKFIRFVTFYFVELKFEKSFNLICPRLLLVFIRSL